MLLKAIVSSYKLNNKYRVRILKYHRPANVAGATLLEDLPFASTCSPPGIIPNYIPGDIVFVDFENDDISKPCILGKLNYEEDTSESTSDINATSLEVKQSTKTTENTKIGNISYEDLLYAVQGFINSL